MSNGPITWDEWQGLPEPKIHWHIRGVAPVESLVMVSGPKKRAYKTFFTMLFSQLALWGIKYKHFPKWGADAPVPVLFLEMESTQWDNRRRFMNIMDGQGLKGAPPAPFLWWHRPHTKLDNPATVRELIALIKKSGCKLVVMDALTFMHRLDPNHERDMAIVGQALMEIRLETGATIMWVNHTNKEGDTLTRDIDLDVRGSGYLTDIYDAHFAIRRNKKKGKLTITQRFKEHPEREIEGYWHLPPESPDGSPPIGPAWVEITQADKEAKQNDVVSRLWELGWQPGQIYPVSAFRSALGISAGQAAEVRAELLKKGLLIAGPDGNGVGLAA